MSSTYFLYAQTGREFHVAQDIRELGLHVDCARKMVFKRTGHQRRPEPHVEPYLPNYLFVNIPPANYLGVMAIKGITSKPQYVPASYLQGITDFMKVTEAEFVTADKIKMNQQMIAEYKVGQALKCLDEGFKDVLLTFREAVDRDCDPFPKIIADADMMGQTVSVEFDPLQVRAAD
jgi:hypothetical protein